MKSRRQYIELPSYARRDFMKWSIGIGAALGLRPWKVFEVTESVVGPALAQQASCSSVMRSVHCVMGNGGLSWMTQLWPHVEIATKQGAAFYGTGKSTLQDASGIGDHPFALGPDAPKFGGKKMTAFIAGNNETHTNKPVSTSSVGTGVGLFAAIAAIQTASPTLVPAISIGALPYGVAAGAPMVASVANPAGVVDLFNSVASSAGGALVQSGDASLFEAYYKANLSLHAAAARPTMASGYSTGKVAANLLGKNLASQLMPQAADLTRYGVTSAMPQKLQMIANTLITTVKAFKLNLTSAVMLPGMNDDPHGAFADMATLASTAQSLGKIWDAFMTDLMAEPDPMCAGSKIGDSVVITWNGDTPKDSLTPGGWPDGTANNSNYVYVLGNGHLKAGWFGQLKANGSLETWDPATGNNVATGGMSSGQLAAPAGAAVLYAVAKSDMRRVGDFFRNDFSGVVAAKTM